MLSERSNGMQEHYFPKDILHEDVRNTYNVVWVPYLPRIINEYYIIKKLVLDKRVNVSC